MNTQNEAKELFKDALEDSRHDLLFGFRNNQILFLTTNERLYKILLHNKEISSLNLQTLNLGTNYLQLLNEKYPDNHKNALYFFQQEGFTHEDVLFSVKVNDNKTFISSTSPNLLHLFKNEVINEHYTCFNIDPFYPDDILTPCLRTSLVVNGDNITHKLTNYGYYNSTEFLKIASKDINNAIDSCQQTTPREF